MIGGYIGSSFDEYNTPGPRLGDLAVQTSQEGAPRPIVYGTPQPFAGNLMQSGEPIRIIVEEETGGGKGGPTYTTDRERAFQTFAIRICEGNENIKLLRYWVEGKLAYSAFGESLDADSVTALSRFTFHAGGEEEMPDPVLEALPAANGGGVGNVPAYRGTCYIVFDNFEITNFGRIPQFSFQVSSNATVSQSCTEGLLAWYPGDDASPGGSAREIVQGLDGVYDREVGSSTVETRGSLNLTGNAATWYDLTDRMRAEDAEALSVNDLAGWSATVWARVDEEALASAQNRVLFVGYSDELSGKFGWGIYLSNNSGSGDYMTPTGGYNNGTGADHVAYSSSDVSPGSINFYALTYDGATIRLYVNAALVGTHATTGTGPAVDLVQIGGGAPGGLIGTVQDGMLWGRALSASEIANSYAVGPGVYEIPDAPGTFMRADGTVIAPCSSSATLSTVTLASIVEDIADRVGVEPSQLDLTPDQSVEVDGYLIGRQMTAQGALSPLCVAYFRDYPEYDLQVHSVPRGASTVATLTDNDWLEDNEDEVSLRQKIELPRKLKVAYADKDTNYVRRVQMAERESVNIPSSGEAEVELPLVFNANAAAQKAEIMLKVTTEESLGTLKRRLPAYKYAQLVTTDRIGWDSKEWRITNLEWIDSEISIEAKRDRISNYVSAAVGGVALDPTAPVSSIKGPSVLQALNLPRLTTGEQAPGMYLSVTGLTNSWPGCDVYYSLDGGLTYINALTITRRATMGYLVNDVAAGSEPITVYAYNERTLSSVSADQITAGANAIAITTDGVSEIKQFQTAAESDENVWALTAVTHGKLDTVNAPHSAEDLWTLLDNAIHFLPIDITHAGKTIYFRAVTRGTPVENNDIVTAVYDPRFTGPADIEYLLDETGADLLDEAGLVLLEE